MKKMKINLLLVIMSMAGMFVVSSCEDKGKDPDTESNVPVKGVDFDFTVDGNNVTFTTTLTGNVWFRNITTSVDLTVVDGTISTKIPSKGVYPFTCNALVDGSTVSSDTFNVEILTDDFSYLNRGVWKSLCGGEATNYVKTWRMDMRAADKYNSLYFDGPMYFSGAEIESVRYPYWAWDLLESDLPYTVGGIEQTGFFNWSPAYADNTWLMSAQDYGTITFDAKTGIVTTSRIGGITETGTFALDSISLKLTINGAILPIDTARLNEGQFLEENLQNLKIFSVGDSGMQIGIKRSYEGKNEDGSQKVSEWTNVYNFVCADYTYEIPTEEPEVFTFEESVKTSFTKADLLGSWKYADIPMGWVAFTKVGDQGTTYPAHLFETWQTRADVVTSLTSWGASKVDSTFTAGNDNVYTFNEDGTCTLNGISNTFTVANGVITFGTALTSTFSEFDGILWIEFKDITELKVIDFTKQGPEAELTDHSFPGIWIGNQNGTKNEYQCVQLVKQ